jgi:hypothetical protein
MDEKPIAKQVFVPLATFVPRPEHSPKQGRVRSVARRSAVMEIFR